MLGAPFGQAALGDEEVPAVAGPVASDRPALFLGRPRLPSESVALGVVALAVGLVEGYLLVGQEERLVHVVLQHVLETPRRGLALGEDERPAVAGRDHEAALAVLGDAEIGGVEHLVGGRVPQLVEEGNPLVERVDVHLVEDRRDVLHEEAVGGAPVVDGVLQEPPDLPQEGGACAASLGHATLVARDGQVLAVVR